MNQTILLQILEYFLYFLCSMFPIRLLAYYPFRHSLRYSFRFVTAMVCLAMLLELGGTGYAIVCGFPPLIVNYLFAPVYMIIYFSNIRMQPSKLLFTYLFATDYLMIVRGTAAFLTVRVFADCPGSWVDSALCAALYLLSMPVMFRFFGNTISHVFETNTPLSLWRTIWLVPAFTSVVVLLFTGTMKEDIVCDWRFLFARVSLLICMFFVYFLLLRSVENLQRQAVLENEAAQTEQLLAAQRSQYAMLQKHVEEVRRARHDMRQHLQIIRSLLNANGADNRQLLEYLDACGTSMPSGSPAIHCKNYAANAVLCYYEERFQEENIRFEIDVELPARLAVPEPDLCVVLGNLLENACYACRDYGTGACARVRCFISGEQAITLIVDNTSARPPVEKNGAFRSSRHSGMGIGTQSVRSIAQKYHGVADFRWEDGMFFVSVFLNP